MHLKLKSSTIWPNAKVVGETEFDAVAQVHGKLGELKNRKLYHFIAQSGTDFALQKQQMKMTINDTKADCVRDRLIDATMWQYSWNARQMKRTDFRFQQKLPNVG